MTTPSWAPRPVPTMIPSGVASPRAHGQAMISTATAALNAALASLPSSNHAASVTTPMVMAMGTKIADTRSASRCTSARLPCAS